MNPKLRVYTLSDYPEELVAVSFAKTSRSPEPFDKMIQELDEEKSSEFHEKWVLKYGHSSVAEHAVLHLAVENASRLAIDVLQNTRLAAYTEKSTRYQLLDKEHSYTPEMEEEYKKEYLETIEFLFQKYNEAIEKLTEYFKQTEPEAKEMDIRLKVIDNARFLLPNATYANVGITVNARALRWMITKMLSHPLKEVQEIGKLLAEKGEKDTPTLLKNIEKSEYLEKVSKKLEEKFNHYGVSPTEYTAKLVEYPKDAEEILIASLLYRFGGIDYNSAKEKAKTMSKEEKEKLIDSILEERGKERPIRELEHVYYTFDLCMDFGAYYEFKRHRMCTISPQTISPEYGYRLPEDFEKAGLKKLFQSAMENSQQTYNKLKEKYPSEAQYLCTNAHKRRVLATMNLRELYHFIRIRSSPYAHFTIQEVAKGMFKELNNIHPLLVKHLRISP